jgi:hypothetical protein
MDSSAGFPSTRRVQHEDLRSLRRVRLNDIAEAHFQERIAEFFSVARHDACAARYWMTSRPTAVFNWLAALKYDPTRLI